MLVLELGVFYVVAAQRNGKASLHSRSRCACPSSSSLRRSCCWPTRPQCSCSSALPTRLRALDVDGKSKNSMRTFHEPSQIRDRHLCGGADRRSECGAHRHLLASFRGRHGRVGFVEGCNAVPGISAGRGRSVHVSTALCRQRLERHGVSHPLAGRAGTRSPTSRLTSQGAKRQHASPIAGPR